MRDGFEALSGRRNDCLGPALCQPCSQRICVIGAISQQACGGRYLREQFRYRIDIMNISGGQQHGNRAAKRITERVYFGRAPTAGLPDRVQKGPPFAPPALRCAFTDVLSIDTYSSPITPVSPVSS